ncbi:putative crocetin glucosyltransferase [Medicago truncatula]|uniref:Putative crocetin glucosyltransferase n=1 Tax=Medicago truncatula TaxID=3880 RepID=A0A396H622_MEDTR|nr:putative crocetin glucosyltransferase [Medicago truncatula]
MEKKVITNKVHCLVLPYPAQGHINPMLQFSKDLQHEGIRVTLVTTLYHRKTLQSVPPSFTIETISDGFDNGGVEEAGGYKAYLGRLDLGDMSSFFSTKGENPVLLDLLVGQFSNIDKADWVLCNTFYELEKEV